MDSTREVTPWDKLLIRIQKPVRVSHLIHWIVLFAVLTACESITHESGWYGEDNFTIGQYLDAHQKDHSKFCRILAGGKLLGTLSAYNPHGDGYTLFLPTDEAVDQFILQNPDYGTLEEILQDTVFIHLLARYHTLNRRVHRDEFPDGALTDLTLSGDRLSVGFYPDGNNRVIKLNNTAPVVQSNLKMTNGYIHVISGVLQKVEISGYDWLQQQNNYSILAQAMELSGIRGKLKWNTYTLFAEHDSVYHRKGIMNLQDLIRRVATPGLPYTNTGNAFYLFTAHHIITGEFYMNDFYSGYHSYLALSNKSLAVDAGLHIRINPGVDTYGIQISPTGDTTLINYILPVWEASNNMTRTGPVHSISEVLFYEPFPK